MSKTKEAMFAQEQLNNIVLDSIYNMIHISQPLRAIEKQIDSMKENVDFYTQEEVCEKCKGTGYFIEDIIGDDGRDGWDKIGEREYICDECF